MDIVESILVIWESFRILQSYLLTVIAAAKLTWLESDCSGTARILLSFCIINALGKKNEFTKSKELKAINTSTYQWITIMQRSSNPIQIAEFWNFGDGFFFTPVWFVKTKIESDAKNNVHSTITNKKTKKKKQQMIPFYLGFVHKFYNAENYHFWHLPIPS